MQCRVLKTGANHCTNRQIQDIRTTAASTDLWVLAELRMPESIKAALASYSKIPGLTREDRAHLQRWSEDDRADEEWQIIDCTYRAVHEHGALPRRVFFSEILAIRRVAEGIASREKYRDR
jgi:hypothetical protein